MCVHVYETVIIIEEAMNLTLSRGSWGWGVVMKGWERCKYSVLKYQILKKKNHRYKWFYNLKVETVNLD